MASATVKLFKLLTSPVPARSLISRVALPIARLQLDRRHFIKERRAQDEREAREHEAQQRLEEEWKANQEANRRLIKQLQTDAGTWHRARYLRRYLDAGRPSPDHQSVAARLPVLLLAA